MNITVYCGAAVGKNPDFKKEAEKLGTWIGKNGHRLIYGGGKVGLMGVLADAVLAAGGQVTGVIPEFLSTDRQRHDGLTELITVETMAQRKTRMVELGDAYIALPGGPGTLEEISEIISMKKLHRNDKPCILYSVDDYYRSLQNALDAMKEQEFMLPEVYAQIHFAKNLQEITQILNREG